MNVNRINKNNKKKMKCQNVLKQKALATRFGWSSDLAYL